jgi:hypothetical protein
VVTRLLAKGIGLVRISRKSKKRMYRFFFLNMFVKCLFLFSLINLFRFFYERALSITRILIIVISMSGLTRGSLVVISNIWMAWLKKVDHDVRMCEREKAE